MRKWFGVLIKDRWRYERALRSPSSLYLALRNRGERLEPAPRGIGFACCWTFTSSLHAPTIQPQLGVRLIQRCLEDAPIRRSRSAPPPAEQPQVSVLIGHRGLERLPLLLATLESFAAQQQVIFECVVIEQNSDPQVKALLPDWVRYVHAPLLKPGKAYNRSQAFNVGARHAHASVLVLHDNDLLVPCHYLQRILEKISLGYQAVNPKRFIFFLSEHHSLAALGEATSFDAWPAEAIMQNAEGGGSMAITREAFSRIGGMDETFEGWGGEDNEFWDRCQTLPCWIWGYEPIIHLWHPSQPLKTSLENPNLLLARKLLAESPQQRIAKLIARRQI